MAKRPESVRVGAHVYDIEWDHDLAQFNAAGVTNNDTLKIGVDQKNALPVQQETMVHELLHAVWNQTSLRTRIPDADTDSPGEAAIQDLAPVLYALLRDNPEVVKWVSS